MIRLIDNSSEAKQLISDIKCATAPILASRMFVAAFGADHDFLRTYGGFDDEGKLCALFVAVNGRLICLIEDCYSKDEIALFLQGFQDMKIFISPEFLNLVNRREYKYCSLMKKRALLSSDNDIENIKDVSSDVLSEYIMHDKSQDEKLHFFLNNSHLVRHGFLKNYSLYSDGQFLSFASVYCENKLSYLCNVFTPECFRNRGYSRQLVCDVTNLSTECHLICIEELSSFYEKCGFQVYDRWIEFLL